VSLHRAAHAGVEERHGEPAVHHADRVVVPLARRDLEHRVPGLDFDQSKPSSSAIGAPGSLRSRMARRKSMPAIERPACASGWGSLHSTVTLRFNFFFS
jgi:hypothetical protein